jgi:hypothetical protein
MWGRETVKRELGRWPTPFKADSGSVEQVGRSGVVRRSDKLGEGPGPTDRWRAADA